MYIVFLFAVKVEGTIETFVIVPKEATSKLLMLVLSTMYLRLSFVEMS